MNRLRASMGRYEAEFGSVPDIALLNAAHRCIAGIRAKCHNKAQFPKNYRAVAIYEAEIQELEQLLTEIEIALGYEVTWKPWTGISFPV